MTVAPDPAQDKVEKSKEQIQEGNKYSLAVAPNTYHYSLSKKNMCFLCRGKESPTRYILS